VVGKPCKYRRPCAKSHCSYTRGARLISVTILTKNCPKYLQQVLSACEHFEEVLIFDNGSQDNTLEIAGQFANVRICKGEFKGFGITHNEAASLAKHDWILSLDSDEVLTPSLSSEINSLKLDPSKVYAISRHNEFNGKFIQWCGWHPDFQVRLFHRKQTAFTEAHVHEAVMTKGMEVVKLKNPMRHYSYDTVADFLTKMQSYSNLFAVQNCGKKSSSPLKALSHAAFAFFKSYILKRGFLGGYEGFIISMYNSHTAFYKYIKLYEANGKMADKMRRCPDENAASFNCSSGSHL